MVRGETTKAGGKTRVAILVDVRGWALEHIANDLVRWFGDCEFDIDVISWVEDMGPLSSSAQRERLRSYDVLWPFCLYEAVKVYGLGFKRYITTVHMAPVEAKVDTETPFSLYWPNFREAGLAATALSTICPPLMKLWGPARNGDVTRVVVGGDPAMFYPPWNPPGALVDKDLAARGRALELVRDGQGTHRVLRVGWIGNPQKPYKRYEIVQEAMAGLPGAALRPIIWYGVGHTIPRTRAQMADYYRNEIDVYVCTSDHEGLPTPAVECSLCGLPVVSVRTGITSEIVEDWKSGFLIDQTALDLRGALVQLGGQEGLLDEMGRAIEVKARPYQWPNAIGAWLEFLREGARRLDGGSRA